MSKMEGKSNFSRRLKQFDGLTWLTPTPLFYGRSTPLKCTMCRPVSARTGANNSTVSRSKLTKTSWAARSAATTICPRTLQVVTWTATRSGLITLTFDLLTSKWGLGSAMSWASLLPIFSLRRPSVLDLESDTGHRPHYPRIQHVLYRTQDRQTDERTDGQRPSLHNAPTLWGRQHNNEDVFR